MSVPAAAGLQLTVSRSAFGLTVWEPSPARRRFEVLVAYPIAVGRPGLETPLGFYRVQTRSRHPDYTYPDSPWVPEELRGVTFPWEDPENPIAGRWIGIDDDEGIGIHGTVEDDSIGTAASHGCIRMHVADIEELFELIPVRTPVFVYD